MFGAKYSRLKFWIITIILFIPTVVLSVFVKVLENSENSEEALIPSIVLFLIALTWLNTLANRIRDYGGSPWFSLLAFIPFANIIMTFYYGIVKSKNKSELNETNDNTTLSKAVYNHSKDIASEIKPAINEYKENHKTTKQKQQSTIDIDEYKQKHSSTKQSEDFYNNINEDEMYEKVMIEIEEDKKVKSTWAKSLAQSEGDKDKAESIYINLRVEQIKNENNQDKLNEKKGEIYDIETKLNDFLAIQGLVLVDRISNVEVIANHKSKPMNSKKIKFFDELGGYWNYSENKNINLKRNKSEMIDIILDNGWKKNGDKSTFIKGNKIYEPKFLKEYVMIGDEVYFYSLENEIKQKNELLLEFARAYCTAIGNDTYRENGTDNEFKIIKNNGKYNITWINKTDISTLDYLISKI